MNSLRTVLDSIYSRLGKLSLVQYRAVCVGVIVGGIFALYLCLPFVPLVGLGRQRHSSERIAELQEQQLALRGELIGLDRRITQYRSSQGRSAEQASLGGNDLVHVLDHAARSASVRVLGLVTAGVSKDLRHTYQLTISGGYPGIVEFVRTIVEQSSAVVVSEVSINASAWMYPSQPLRATVILQSAP